MNTQTTPLGSTCRCGNTRFHVEEVQLHVADGIDGHIQITRSWAAEFIRFVCVACKARYGMDKVDTARLCMKLES